MPLSASATSKKTKFGGDLDQTSDSLAVGTESTLSKMMAYIKLFIKRVNQLRLMRAIQRYGNEKGSLLAGGIAYAAIFSMAAALTIGLTVSAKLIGRNQELRFALYQAIDQFLPGVLSWQGHQGMIDPDTLVFSLSYSITGVVAVVMLLLSAIHVMSSLKMAIRAMFGLSPTARNAVLEKLFDLLGFVVLSVGVLATGLLSLANRMVGARITEYLGWNKSVSWFIIAQVSLLLCVLVDALVLWILVEIIAQVKAPRKDLCYGLLVYAVVSAVFRSLGTSVLSSTGNLVLASFAALVLLLLWVNLLARVVLLSSAFIANPPLIDRPQVVTDKHSGERPNFVTLSVPETLSWSKEILEVPVDEDLQAAGVIDPPSLADVTGSSTAHRMTSEDTFKPRGLQSGRFKAPQLVFLLTGLLVFFKLANKRRDRTVNSSPDCRVSR